MHLAVKMTEDLIYWRIKSLEPSNSQIVCMDNENLLYLPLMRYLIEEEDILYATKEEFVKKEIPTATDRECAEFALCWLQKK